MDQDELPDKLLKLSGGLLGELHKLLKVAAKEAIANGSEQITPGLLDEILKAGRFTPPTLWGQRTF